MDCWGVDHHNPRFGRQGLPQLVCGHFEILFNAGVHGNHFSSRQVGHVGVANPVWRWKNHFIAWVDQAQHHIHQALLGAGGNHNLVGSVFQAVVPPQFVANGFSDVCIPWHWRVVGEVVFDGLDAGSFDGVGSIEVRLAQRQANDVPASSFEFAGLSAHGNGG